MPNLANITVKKNDGTTDITYTGVEPSGGPKVPAVWRSQTVGSAQAHQPDLRISSVASVGNSTLKEVKGTYRYPQIATNTTTGVTSVVRSCRGSFSFVLDTAMVQADANEAASQFGNLIASALVKEIMKTGASAT